MSIQRRLRPAVWSRGGRMSWYLDADGVNRARASRADYAIR